MARDNILNFTRRPTVVLAPERHEPLNFERSDNIRRVIEVTRGRAEAPQPAQSNRPHTAEPDPFAEPSECVEDMLGAEADAWAIFWGGAILGFLAGFLAVAVPAVVLAWWLS